MMSHFNTSTDSLKKEYDKDLELSFVFEPRQEADELIQKKLDVKNPVNLPWEDEPRLKVPDMGKRLYNNPIRTKCYIGIEASHLCCN